MKPGVSSGLPKIISLWFVLAFPFDPWCIAAASPGKSVLESVGRRGLLERIDSINHEQNHIRQRLVGILNSHQEFSMALENLAVELEKQREDLGRQKNQLQTLIKIAYRVRRDGIVRFLLDGNETSQITARLRVLLYALQSHGIVVRDLAEREARLAEGEQKLKTSQRQAYQMVEQLKEQQELLSRMLSKKRSMLSRIERTLHGFRGAEKEYRQLSHQVTELFDTFELNRDVEERLYPNKGSLPLPVGFGRVLKTFGKFVHEKFQTVTYQQGIELEAEHDSPVTAVLPGSVDFVGWLKGLGNVVIVHHGGGFYSLHAHLYRTTKAQGSRVQQGEVIGYVGDTGTNERSSLYFELRENGKAVDPLAYFSKDAVRKLY